MSRHSPKKVRSLGPLKQDQKLTSRLARRIAHRSRKGDG